MSKTGDWNGMRGQSGHVFKEKKGPVYGRSSSTCPPSATLNRQTGWQSSRPSSPPRSTTSARTSPSIASLKTLSAPTDSCRRCLPPLPHHRQRTSAPAPAAPRFPSFARSNRTPHRSSARTPNPTRHHHYRRLHSFLRRPRARAHRHPFHSQARSHATAFSLVLRESTTAPPITQIRDLKILSLTMTTTTTSWAGPSIHRGVVSVPHWPTPIRVSLPPLLLLQFSLA